MCVYEGKEKRKVRWEGEGGRKRKKWGDAVCLCVGVRGGGQAQTVLITATVGGG